MFTDDWIDIGDSAFGIEEGMDVGLDLEDED